MPKYISPGGSYPSAAIAAGGGAAKQKNIPNDYIEIRRLYNGEDRQYAGIILPLVLKAWKTAAAATHYDPDLYLAPSIIKVLKDVNAEAPPPPPPKPIK